MEAIITTPVERPISIRVVVALDSHRTWHHAEFDSVLGPSEAEMKEIIYNELIVYFETLIIGEDVKYNKLVNIIMGVRWVCDVWFLTPHTDILIGSDEVSILEDFTVTFDQ